jgi:DNA-binding HxlR family transcriptional regulator
MTKLSTETFIEQTENGNIKTAKMKVYRFLKVCGECTLDFMRAATGISHQTLTARLSELMDMGIVWQNDRNEFYTTEKHQWPIYSDMRREERYQKWLKAGEKEGFTV